MIRSPISGLAAYTRSIKDLAQLQTYSCVLLAVVLDAEDGHNDNKDRAEGHAERDSHGV